MNLRKHLLLFLFLALTTTASAAEQVLCFGDSITEGTYIEGKWVRGNSWVNAFNKLGKGEIKAINAGRSGRKTSDMAGLNNALKQHPKIDHAVLFLGVNDLRISTDNVLDACVTNTHVIVKRVRQAYPNVQVTILSSPGLDVPNVTQRFAKMGYDGKEQAMLDKLRVRYKNFAAENSCHYIDLWGVVSAGNFTDGLHPGTTGQKQIARTVWQNWPRPKMTTTTPVTQNRDRRIYDWMTRHKEVLKRHQTVKPDVITLGDSITHFWSGLPKAPLAWGNDAWATLFDGYAVTNMGCGWDRTENVVWRLQNGQLNGISPKVAMILIGTNNLPVKNTPREIYWGVKSVVDEIHKQSPTTKVLVLGILPRKSKFAHTPAEVNQLLANLDDRPFVRFYNANSALLDEEGNRRGELYRDGVHVNAAGYAALAKVLRPIIVEMAQTEE